MQDRKEHDSPPPDFTLAMNKYIMSLGKLRSLNTLVNQKISAEEFLENIKHARRKKAWIQNYFSMLEDQLKKDEVLEENRQNYENLLKFARENPLVMSMGIASKEFELAETIRQQALQQLNQTIKEVEEIINILTIRRQELVRKIAAWKKELNDIDERCQEAALNLYTLPKDPDESTELSLSNVMALQKYLSKEMPAPVIKVNHTRIIENYKQLIRENPKDIDERRLNENLSHAMRTEVRDQLDVAFNENLSHVPESERSHLIDRVIDAIEPTINETIKNCENQEQRRAFAQASEERAQIKSNKLEAEAQIEIIDENLELQEETLKCLKKEKNALLVQGKIPIQEVLAKSSHAVNDDRMIADVVQAVDKKEETPNASNEQQQAAPRPVADPIPTPEVPSSISSKDDAIPNFTSSAITAEKPARIPVSSEEPIKPPDMKSDAALPQPKAAKNESSIQLEEGDKSLNKNDSVSSDKAPMKTEEDKQYATDLKHSISQSTHINQEQLRFAFIGNTKAITDYLKTEQPAQVKSKRSRMKIPDSVIDITTKKIDGDIDKKSDSPDASSEGGSILRPKR